MKTCPFCAEQIQDEAVKCRFCGEWLNDRQPRVPIPIHMPSYYYNYEYRSKTELLGLPIVHIAQGFDPKTGRVRVAKGIIAIGNIAVGFFALGGIALGGVAFGGFGLGVLVFGGVALGAFALGGMAFGLILALGGMAVSTLYAIGGLALAPHSLSPLGVDPQIVEWIRRFLHFDIIP